MALQVTQVNRNLQTRVTFMYLEFEDLFVVLGAAAVMNVVGHFVGGQIAGMPMNLVLHYGVPLFMVPMLMVLDSRSLVATRRPPSEVSTSIAKASRVKSSTMFKVRNLRPELSASVMKSTDHV